MQLRWLKSWVFWIILIILIIENVLAWKVTLPFWQGLFTDPAHTVTQLRAIPLAHSAFAVLKACSGLTCLAALAALMALRPAARHIYKVHMILAITASVLLAGNRLYAEDTPAASMPLTVLGLVVVIVTVSGVYLGLIRLARKRITQSRGAQTGADPATGTPS
ncbi:hypothetical protein [Pseudoruegeria sp. SK021]|uniref:hypothetical protein n=1 Tax=Pseudoruegeria sp. SK021 TaxID=1933035 RepID=UPI000A220196|nr:hypothetical protein [Pseudoruegeria sp. SK021]OSP56112.1 hypothetical protein BV911_04015 [Pseudoruegeria sp. SK021]